jgi:hypothetical protein
MVNEENKVDILEKKVMFKAKAKRLANNSKKTA